MRLTTQSNTKLGELLQAFCLTLLRDVVGQLGADDAEVLENGQTSAKVILPTEEGADYLYIGFDEKGSFRAEYMAHLASGRPIGVWGPISLAKMTALTMGAIAHKIVSGLPSKT